MAFQLFRRVQNIAQRMGHAVGADVAKDETVFQSPSAGQLRVPVTRPVAPKIDAVADDGDFVSVDAPGRQVVLESLGQGDHGFGAGVEMQFQLFDQPKRQPRLHRADGGDGGRPQIAQLEHERHPARPG